MSFRAKWWGMVAIEVAPDGKFDINRFFERNYRNWLDFRMLYNGLKENINKLNDYWDGTLNGDEY